MEKVTRFLPLAVKGRISWRLPKPGLQKDFKREEFGPFPQKGCSRAPSRMPLLAPQRSPTRSLQRFRSSCHTAASLPRRSYQAAQRTHASPEQVRSELPAVLPRNRGRCGQPPPGLMRAVNLKENRTTPCFLPLPKVSAAQQAGEGRSGLGQPQAAATHGIPTPPTSQGGLGTGHLPDHRSRSLDLPESTGPFGPLAVTWLLLATRTGKRRWLWQSPFWLVVSNQSFYLRPVAACSRLQSCCFLTFPSSFPPPLQFSSSLRAYQCLKKSLAYWELFGRNIQIIRWGKNAVSLVAEVAGIKQAAPVHGDSSVPQAARLLNPPLPCPWQSAACQLCQLGFFSIGTGDDPPKRVEFNPGYFSGVVYYAASPNKATARGQHLLRGAPTAAEAQPDPSAPGEVLREAAPLGPALPSTR